MIHWFIHFHLAFTFVFATDILENEYVSVISHFFITVGLTEISSIF